MNSKQTINRWVMLAAITAGLFAGNDAMALRFKSRSSVRQMSKKPVPSAAYAEINEFRKRIYPGYVEDRSQPGVFGSWAVAFGLRDNDDTSITFYTAKGKRICTEYYAMYSSQYDIEEIQARLTAKPAVHSIEVVAIPGPTVETSYSHYLNCYDKKKHIIACWDLPGISKVQFPNHMRKNSLISAAAIEQVKKFIANPNDLKTMRINKEIPWKQPRY